MRMRLSEFTERLDSPLDTEAFAGHDRSPDGLQVGPREAEVEQVAFAADAVRETAGAGVLTLDFGPDRLEDVAVLTGIGGGCFGEAGVDRFVTGESSDQLYHEAREAGGSAVMAGHYETEIFGVRRLQDLAEEWGLETTFIGAPTGF